MKLDNEPVRGHSTLVLKPVCKSIVNPLEMVKLKSENEILTEDKHRMTSVIKSQNCEKVDPLETEERNDDRVGNLPKSLSFVSRNDIMNRRGNKIEDSVTRCTIPSSEVELSEKGECYTDKSVMDCEEPEQIACSKVDACHTVKDICVDEEVPFLDKVLIEHGEVDLKRGFQPSYLDLTDASRKSVHSPSLISDGIKSSVGHYHNVDISGQCGSQNLLFKSNENIHPKDDTKHNEMNSLDGHIHGENVSIQHCSKNEFQKGEANIDAKDKIPQNIPYHSPSLISDGMQSSVGHYHNVDISCQCGSQKLLLKSDENIHPKDDTTHNEMNSLDEHIHDENVSIQYCSKNELQKGEANIDPKDEIPHNIPVPENLHLFHNLEKENCKPDSYPYKSDEAREHSEQEHLCSVGSLLQENEGKIDADEHITKGISDDVLPLNVPLLQKTEIENSCPASSNFNSNEDEQQSEQDTSNEVITSYSAVCSVAEEPSDSSCADKPPFDTKIERASITFNFDSPTRSSKEESLHNAYSQQHLQTPQRALEDGTVDSLTTSSHSFLIQDGHGESSFSAVGPLSGPISYSGPISHSGPVPYSGSISLRSDSSTTSTRSFAFPILHSESNGSPVKMAKADRRHFRKQRGWRLNLLCCRF